MYGTCLPNTLELLLKAGARLCKVSRFSDVHAIRTTELSMAF